MTTPSDTIPNPDAILATWRWLAHAQHGVSEVRVIRPGGGGLVGLGFFDDEEAFVAACAAANADGNVYVGIQPRPRRLLELAPNVLRPLRTGAGSKDIEVVTATVVDLDPVRPKDTASTEDELSLTLQVAEAAAAWCEAQGLARPRLMMSGNGAQLWFALPSQSLAGEAQERVQAGLKAFEAEVRARFQSERVHVDSIHDVARIIKVVGTVSRKGAGTAERPHRAARALAGFERVEDAGLLARLLSAPVQQPVAHLARPAQVALPLAPSTSAPQGTVKARRTATGEYDWAHPVEMCGPVQRLWEQGAEDRSVAIFNMVRFFVHKGLGLDEITELVLEYDRRGLGKLKGRDGVGYIRKAYEKVVATAREDSTVAPPCHSLQGLGFCRVNREPDVRCELYDVVFDVEKAVEALATVPAQDVEYRLKPILEAIAHRPPSAQEKYLALLEVRTGLAAQKLRLSMARAVRTQAAGEGADTKGGGKSSSGDDTIDGEVYEDAYCYYTVTQRGEAKAISSFTFTPTALVETEEGEVFLGDVRTDKGAEVEGARLPRRAFNSRKELLHHLPSVHTQWTGSDNNVQGLLRSVARRAVPRLPGTTVLGDFKRGAHHVWVAPGCTIGKEGFLAASPVAYLPNGTTLESRIRYEAADDDAFHDVASTVFEYLLKINTPQVVLPILGWFFATPMKPRFMEKVGSFPLLFPYGTQGSGKSSTCTEVFWPLFGVPSSDAFSVTETEFALVKLLSATRSVPVVVDEYKPGDMPLPRLHLVHRYMRRLYRGETEERGRPDLSVVSYRLQAPLCICGETRPTEAALVERLLPVNPEKATVQRRDCRAAFRKLTSVNLALFAPRYIQFCLGRDFEADYRVVRAVAEVLLEKRDAPPRVADNVTAMLLGIHLFEEFAKECGYALPEDLGAREAVDAVLKDVLEEETGVRNALDAFIQMLGVMAIQGELKHRVHYAFDDGRLCLHLESAYDAYRAHCKRIDYRGELVDTKALRRLIHENHRAGEYVLSPSERVCFAGKALRRCALVIDVSKAPFISAEDFPHAEDASRGWRWRGHDEGSAEEVAS
ncbi:hypothetical protein D7Y13_07720 [Corallococcus praedator]|uniref:DUF927 domain-containing protein n=1 Tax=Corallococcus praedator TaxID=2316724 RepID=A0ABX9QPL4_9BACT|nr:MULTISPECIES: hypothetical protein [Corallococcus]RKH35632.1 hypothetical protein D7X75_03340 [Corallococcus sp. CA031C]RKI13317.1 hypothetical protein D7Y13_07720 [Corallococcus praedator]